MNVLPTHTRDDEMAVAVELVEKCFDPFAKGPLACQVSQNDPVLHSTFRPGPDYELPDCLKQWQPSISDAWEDGSDPTRWTRDEVWEGCCNPKLDQINLYARIF